MAGRCKDFVDSAFNSKVVNQISDEQKDLWSCGLGPINSFSLSRFLKAWLRHRVIKQLTNPYFTSVIGMLES